MLLGVGLLGSSVVKNPHANTGIMSINDSWVRKILWRRKWQPIPVFLPGKSHAQRNLVGYSPRGLKSQTRLSTYVRIYTVNPRAITEKIIKRCKKPMVEIKRNLKNSKPTEVEGKRTKNRR